MTIPHTQDFDITLDLPTLRAMGADLTDPMTDFTIIAEAGQTQVTAQRRRARISHNLAYAVTGSDTSLRPGDTLVFRLRDHAFPAGHRLSLTLRIHHSDRWINIHHGHHGAAGLSTGERRTTVHHIPIDITFTDKKAPSPIYYCPMDKTHRKPEPPITHNT